MTTDNSIKQGDTVKVIDAQHYAAGNVGVVKTITKDVHKVEVVLANGVKETIDFVRDQIGGVEEDIKQNMGLVGAVPAATEPSAQGVSTTPTKPTI